MDFRNLKFSIVYIREKDTAPHLVSGDTLTDSADRIFDQIGRDTMALSKKEVDQLIASVPFWYHSISLGESSSPGLGSPKAQARQLRKLHIPDVAGKSVLDIGAWDGFYSFECERRGAKRVVALDHYAWSLDLGPYIQEWGSDADAGERSRHWRPDELPGKRGYDTAHRILNSRVETVVNDFMVADLDELGSFDLVLYLGVLYHVENPLQALKRLASVTKELAIIETSAIALPFSGSAPLCEFFATDELNNDASNWWAPNISALEGMCQAAGFRRVEVVVGPSVVRWVAHSCLSWLRLRPSSNQVNRCPMYRYRAVVHAWK